MNGKLKKHFNDTEICTFIWNGKPCWAANNIAEMLGYINTSKTIMNCIKREQFICSLNNEYEILVGDDLKLFKGLMDVELREKFKYAPKIIIFYEKGLYGYLQYTEKPLGITFRFWIRDEVLPEIRRNGYYSVEESNSKKKKLLTQCKVSNDFDVDKFQRLRFANETMKAFKESLDKVTDNEMKKLKVYQAIYAEVGINIPIDLDEEDLI